MPAPKTLIRTGDGPLLTRKDLPGFDPSGVFNPGAVRIGNKVLLMLRVQTRGRRTLSIPAFSTDGIGFQIAEKPTVFSGLKEQDVFHIYDARLTLLEKQLVVTTALDTPRGCRCAIWAAAGNTSGDFGGLEKLELISLIGDSDTRNAVLFPQKTGGRFALLHRPNQTALAAGPLSGSAIHLSYSDNLKTWQDAGPILWGHPHYWDELIGSGPPPIKTRHGWLHLYHGIATHFQSSNVYQAGAVLLDLNDPTRVLARTRGNILEPREMWELTGQVPNVVFPSGATVSHTDANSTAADDALVNVYYGAADTVIGLATSTVGDLVAACRD